MPTMPQETRIEFDDDNNGTIDRIDTDDGNIDRTAVDNDNDGNIDRGRPT